MSIPISLTAISFERIEQGITSMIRKKREADVDKKLFRAIFEENFEKAIAILEDEKRSLSLNNEIGIPEEELEDLSVKNIFI